MPQIRDIEQLVGRSLKVERTTGGAVTGTLSDVYYDAGGHPQVISIEKPNGDIFHVPWHAVRSFVEKD